MSRAALTFICQRWACTKVVTVKRPYELKRRKYCSRKCAAIVTKSRTVPLFITCQRPGCGQLKEVRRPHEQRRRKYCSRACASACTQNIRKANPQLGARNSIKVRRQRVLDRLDGLSKRECFRLGYRFGLCSKTSQLRRRYLFVRKDSAA